MTFFYVQICERILKANKSGLNLSGLAGTRYYARHGITLRARGKEQV
jgi:hypothetical protein